jgi:hypothetical protein
MRLTETFGTRRGKAAIAGATAVLLLGAAGATWLPVSGATASERPLSHDGWTVTGVPVDKGDILAVAALGEKDAYAVGYKLVGLSDTQPVLLHWDGAAWTQQSALPANTFPQMLSVQSATDIWAAGQDTAHWDGTAWTVVRSARDPGGRFMPEAIGRSADGKAWVAGRAVPGSIKTSVPAVQSWNGTAWVQETLPAMGVGELDSISVLAANDIWAAGTLYPTSATTPEAPLVVHFDGTSWQRVTVPGAGTANTVLSGVTALGANDVWAVGSSSTTGADRPFAVHWDGSKWAVASTPNVPDGRLRGVGRRGNGELWAVGGKGGVSVALRWNARAKKWDRVPAANVVTRSFTMVPNSSSVWAVGIAKTGDMIPAIEHYTR